MGLFFRDERKPVAPVVGSGASLPGRHAKAASYGTVRSITASAVRLDKSSRDFKGPAARDWQRDAWVGYDRIGEIHYGFNLLANTFSRIRIVPGVIVDFDAPPASVGQALQDKKIDQRLADAVNRLMTALVATDFSSVSKSFVLNMAVAGECLLVQLPSDDPFTSEGQWVIKSTDELKVESDKIRLKSSTGSNAAAGSDTDVIARRETDGNWTPDISIGRIWKQHPRHSDEADSSLRSVADPIEELLLLSRLIRSASRSRLNAGMLFIPDTVAVLNSAASPGEIVVDADGKTVDEPAVDDVNGFISDLMDSMLNPVEDEGSPSGVVPMVLTGPGEAGDQIKHITFARSSDDWLVGRADRALERILQGIDIPKEVVTGLANVKYSNALQIDEDLYKTNIEPLALVFVDALTDIYLRPSLLSEGFSESDINKVCVWYDPAEIVTRPNQSDEATQGYDRFLLSAEAWRKTHGFNESDAPTEKELAVQLLFSKGQFPEDLTNKLMRQALPNVMQEERAANMGADALPMPPSASDILSPGTSVGGNDSASTSPNTDVVRPNVTQLPTEGNAR